MIQRSVMIWLIMILFLPHAGLAAPTAFIEKYAYNAGESDSKLTCRTVSLIEVKRLLLEKIGTYLESRTEMKNFQIEKDEIVALTAGIVKLEILDEKWNGETYTLTARIEANPDDIAQAISDLSTRQDRLENIEKVRAINEESLKQIRDMQSRMQTLQSDLLKVNQDASANKGLLNAWGLYEKAVEWRQSGRVKEALDALNTVIGNNPTHVAFFQRGMAYFELKKYDKAIADFSESLKAEPNLRGSLWMRGLARVKSGSDYKGRKDIEKAASLGQPMAKKWLENHPRKRGDW